jgi:hypothetical protein
MKLYSEEQLREVVRLSLEDAEKSVIWSKESYPSKLANIIMKDLTPIELPSDEEIEDASLEENNDDLSPAEEFQRGAIWMRNKIQGGEQ